MATHNILSRRAFLKTTGAGLFLAGLSMNLPLPAWARPKASPGIGDIAPRNHYGLTIAYSPIEIDGRQGKATSINGTVPGPLIRLKEGDTVQLDVTNRLADAPHSSIHWHGILLPFPMDGVPGVTFDGIRAGETYHYRFRVGQAGTYWYHSHSRFQEQTGTYGPLIIDPKNGEPFAYDRDHTIVLSDWSFEDPEVIFRNINLMGHYYNVQQRTVWDFLADAEKNGLTSTWKRRMAWARMRMNPVDLADVTGATYTYLINGKSPAMNWTGLFTPGEVLRLRVINAAAATNFDLRIPGLDMNVVMADGKAVKPVRVGEIRIGVAETYDVLVRPEKEAAFTIFAESLDRSGYARGTLAPRPGMAGPVPPRRPRPVRTLEDIGMDMMLDGEGGHDMGSTGHGTTSMGHDAGHTMGASRNKRPKGPAPLLSEKHNPNVAMVVSSPKDRLAEPGIGLGNDGWRVLTYKDLVSDEPQPYAAVPDREMTIHITANMERYLFSFDGKKFTEHEGPYHFRHNERLRLYLVNHTMMEHPIHLHGMWMQLENGAGNLPFKHTVLVKPGEVMSLLITPVEKGDWAFHCHLLYHMEAGMFQVVRVS